MYTQVGGGKCEQESLRFYVGFKQIASLKILALPFGMKQETEAKSPVASLHSRVCKNIKFESCFAK